MCAAGTHAAIVMANALRLLRGQEFSLMANRPRSMNPPTPQSRVSIPLLILAAFGLGAGGMWLVMHESPVVSEKMATIGLAASLAAGRGTAGCFTARSSGRRADMANWNYDRQNWPHAIEHYRKRSRAAPTRSRCAN
jgi:hypothetical protein